mgnify:CR=1 FL=1
MPGKVEVSAEYCSESRCYYLKGEYMNYINIGGKTAPVASWKTEKMDRWFVDADLFVSFFKQRAAYMMASPEEQIAFEGHPATYGMVSDSFAKVI